jgi:hypothetical protein
VLDQRGQLLLSVCWTPASHPNRGAGPLERRWCRTTLVRTGSSQAKYMFGSLERRTDMKRVGLKAAIGVGLFITVGLLTVEA